MIQKFHAFGTPCKNEGSESSPFWFTTNHGRGRNPKLRIEIIQTGMKCQTVIDRYQPRFLCGTKIWEEGKGSIWRIGKRGGGGLNSVKVNQNKIIRPFFLSF